MNIAGVSAIVTGGSSGLGAGVAARLRAGGAKIAILDVNEPRQSSPDDFFFRTDVSRSDQIEAAIAAVIEHQGVPRILVNCAGIGDFVPIIGPDGPPDLDHFLKALRINLIGTYDTIRQTAFRMARETPINGERGVIINTASIAGFDGLEGQAAYSASKSAIIGMTLPLARDLAAHQIRINSIAPGVFRTALLAGLPLDVEIALTRQTPFPSRMGDPSEFASLVAHIIDNPMLNGETIRLDAGLRMTFEHPA